MIKLTMRVIMVDRNRNKQIKGTAAVERNGVKLKVSRLRCYDHVLNRREQLCGKESHGAARRKRITEERVHEQDER